MGLYFYADLINCNDNHWALTPCSPLRKYARFLFDKNPSLRMSLVSLKWRAVIHFLSRISTHDVARHHFPSIPGLVFQGSSQRSIAGRDNRGPGWAAWAGYAQQSTMRINDGDRTTPPHQLQRQRSSYHGNRPTAEAINDVSWPRHIRTGCHIKTPTRKRSGRTEKEKNQWMDGMY